VASSRTAAIPLPPARVAGSATPLFVDVEVDDGLAVLRLSGTLAGAAAPRAREAMARALADRPRSVVVDLSGVATAEDSGAVLLVAMRRHGRRLGCAPRFVGIDAGVREVLRRRGIDRLLDIPGR
jgi:anti-anti-sigma factor